MDVSHLKPDEIEVEFDIRGLSSGSDQGIDDLRNLLIAEQTGTALKPNRMHSKASRRPDIEIAGCNTKLKNFQEDIINLRDLEPEENRPFIAISLRSRLRHIQGRLERVTLSPTYGAQAQESLISCSKLLVSLDQYLSNNDLLNDSIESARMVEIGKTAVITSEESASFHAGSLLTDPIASDNHASSVRDPNKNPDQTALVTALMNQVALLSEQIKTLSQGVLVAPPVGQEPNTKAEARQSFIPLQSSATIKTTCAQVQFQEPPLYTKSHILPDAIYVNTTKAVDHISGARHPMQFGVPPNPVFSPHALHNSTLHPPIMSQNSASVDGSQSQYPLLYAKDGPDRRSLARCGISYSGSPTGITVDMFLFQLDSVMMSMRISHEFLILDLHLLLRDVALQWYWTYRRHNPLASWNDLKLALVERFKDKRTPYEIRRMVESRKQQPQESFLEYYHHMWGLTLQCHTPYQDDEFIQLLINNMKPLLQFYLTDRHFTTINELIRSCTAWEDTIKRFPQRPDTMAFTRRAVNEVSMENFDINQQPMSLNATSLDPSAKHPLAAFQGPSGLPASTSILPNKLPVVSGHSRVPLPAMGNSNPICFNCSDIGHTFKNCPVPPTGYFCFRCGLRDTITPRCSRCAGNQVSGSWKTGMRESQHILPPRTYRENAACNTDPELRRRQSTLEKDTL